MPQVLFVPVRPHIRSWMIQVYGPEPITANERNLVGSVIRNALTGLKPGRPVAKAGGSILKVQPSWSLDCAGKDNAINELGYLLEEHFTLAVISFFTASLINGKSMHQTVEDFFDAYKLNREEYDPECVRKIYRDHLNRTKARRDKTFPA